MTHKSKTILKATALLLPLALLTNCSVGVGVDAYSESTISAFYSMLHLFLL